jgi:hypothetical protein
MIWHLDHIFLQVQSKKILIVQFLMFPVNSIGQIYSSAPYLCFSSVWVRAKVHRELWIRIFAYISLCLLRNLCKKNTFLNNDLQSYVLRHTTFIINAKAMCFVGVWSHTWKLLINKHKSTRQYCLCTKLQRITTNYGPIMNTLHSLGCSLYAQPFSSCLYWPL